MDMTSIAYQRCENISLFTFLEGKSLKQDDKFKMLGVGKEVYWYDFFRNKRFAFIGL